MSTSNTARFRPALERFETRDVPAAFAFNLPGATGYGDFSDPTGVDTSAASQSISVPDLFVSFQSVPLTAADASGSVAANYAFGVFVGVTASFDLSSFGGPYTSLALAASQATGTDAASATTTVPINAAVPQPRVSIDFTPATIDLTYSIKIRLNDDSIVSITINGTNKTAAQIATEVRTQLRDNGFGASDVEVNGGKIAIYGHGDAKVENVSVTIIETNFYGRNYPFTKPDVAGVNGATGSSNILFPTPAP